MKGNVTCLLYKDKAIITSSLHGVAPLLSFLSSGVSYKGFSIVDRVTGKAAAFLYVLLGLKAIHAETMSEAALEYLRSEGIKADYDHLVPAIMNHARSDRCPLEKAVEGLSDPLAALKAIKKTIAAMKKETKVS